ncbi:Rib/alpha-like domain-containing protein [Corynebacterium hadale]|uniref:Rib/alpha-like domain-containing protein n=1 Tax=Corynebacterium hadale TaxID=2026255 RepID=UPI001055219A|nr:Rib/alpha-like domain-containing protein [Corynebacterium hadale]
MAQTSIEKVPNLAPVIDADALANGYTDMQNAVSGGAKVGDTAENVPDGAEVFLQWIDTDGAVSPTYRTRVHDGRFSFDLRDGFHDANGKSHTFSALEGQLYKLWMDPLKHPQSGNMMWPMFAYASINPGEFVTVKAAEPRETELQVGVGISDVGIRMYEMPDLALMTLPEREWIWDEGGSNLWWLEGGVEEPIGWYSGSVSRYTEQLGFKVGSTWPSDGYEVVFSVLDKGYVDKYKSATNPSNGATAKVEDFLRSHPEAIGATVATKLDSTYFTVRFPTGVVTEQNRDFVYGYVRDENGNVVTALSPWTRPVFGSPAGGSLEVNPGPAPLTHAGGYSGIDFSVPSQHYVAFSFDNPDPSVATVQPGQKVRLQTQGTQLHNEPGSFEMLRNGQQIRFGPYISSGSNLGDYELTVPLDARDGDTITVTAFYGSPTSPYGAASAVVKLPEYALEYTEVLLSENSPAIAEANFVGMEPPERVARFELPEGYQPPEGVNVYVDPFVGAVDVSLYKRVSQEKIEIPIDVRFENGGEPISAKAVFYVDSDGDGTPDYEDLDDDGDGISDERDMDPKDPQIGNDSLGFSLVSPQQGVGYPGQQIHFPVELRHNGSVVGLPSGAQLAVDATWAEINDAGVITARIPENATPGSSMSLPVTLTHRDGSTNEAIARVAVRAVPVSPTTTNPTPSPTVTRPRPTVATTMPKPVATTSSTSFAPTPKPTTPSPSLARPTVSVAPDPAERYNDRYTPTFPTAYARADKTSLSVDPLATLHDQGEMFDNQPLPVGTTLKAKTPGTQIVRVPGEDGTIRQLVEYTPPTDAAPGEVHEVTVEVVYPDGSVDEVLVPFEIVEKTQADETPLGYESGKAAAPNRAVKIVQTGTRDLPADVEFIAGHKNDLRGWRVSVDPHTGDLRATAPENATPLSFTTVALFADGSTKEITTTIGVAEARADTDQYQPVYREAIAKAGEQATSARHGNVGANTSFALADAAGLADVVVDKRNGTFKATVPANAVPGTRYFPVLAVRYADGSSEFITAEVVADSIARTARPEWAELSVPVGDTTSEDTKRDAPDNTTFALKDTFEAPNWDVSIDPATGELTVRADENVRENEEVVIPVVATFEDNSQKEVKVRAKAAKRIKPTAQTPTPPTSKVVTTTVTAPAPPAQNSGSSVGSILAVVLGALALIGGAGFAAVQNQDLIREVLRQNGINF